MEKKERKKESTNMCYFIIAATNAMHWNGWSGSDYSMAWWNHNWRTLWKHKKRRIINGEKKNWPLNHHSIRKKHHEQYEWLMMNFGSKTLLLDNNWTLANSVLFAPSRQPIYHKTQNPFGSEGRNIEVIKVLEFLMSPNPNLSLISFFSLFLGYDFLLKWILCERMLFSDETWSKYSSHEQ